MESQRPTARSAQSTIDAVPALDWAFLAQSTFGDDALKGEVIALFRKQLAQAREQIASAATASEWRFVMHTLKGASAAVGAAKFAALAEEWEKAVFPSESQRQHILNDFDLAKADFMSAAQQA